MGPGKGFNQALPEAIHARHNLGETYNFSARHGVPHVLKQRKRSQPSSRFGAVGAQDPATIAGQVDALH